jgi:hypothetical protein
MTDLQTKFGMDDTQWALANIFQANALNRIGQCLDAGTRFVHYTTADKAMKLLSNREVWLRKSTRMNDFMEIEHGYNCLSKAWQKNKPNFVTQFEELFPGICGKIESHFDGWFPSYRTGTFIACVSEHDDDPAKNEDRMGRLSMWRAYGGTAGVAIVMKGGVFHRPVSSDALKAYTSPVVYLDVEGFNIEFVKLISAIESNLPLMKSIGEQHFLSLIAHAFRYATICTKHPGFLEEREWRVIYSPAVGKSEIIKECIESIEGIPQKVCKLPLVDSPDKGLTDLELPKLIDRIIIGPSHSPFEIYEAMVELMNNAGIADAASKVFVSDIPLRQTN